jgi:acetyl-CoA C-acetyltransferase
MVDVYSCFPVAVQIAAAEIGLDTSRPLTITGGLTFAGGPLNNYVMHAIARGVELLREQRRSRCLITANGGYLTKHAFGIYAAEPPPQPFRHQDVQDEVDATPSAGTWPWSTAAGQRRELFRHVRRRGPEHGLRGLPAAR